jgi:hypothetical protein
MRQAILTRYLGPTNKLGARVVAKTEGKRIVLFWDYTLDGEGNYHRAAKLLAGHLGWTGRLVGGSLPGCQHAFVILDEE